MNKYLDVLNRDRVHYFLGHDHNFLFILIHTKSYETLLIFRHNFALIC